MIRILSEKIHDNRFLRLHPNMLKAGYLEDWVWNARRSPAHRKAAWSRPILSNIYLHKLDVFVETVLIPQYTRGKARERNPDYRKVKSRDDAGASRAGDRVKARELRQQLRRLPSAIPHDPGYRRLRYSRYADDHLLGFTGPKAEAEAIKDQLARFLRDELALELNAGQDADHPRPHPGGPIPRLRDHRTARRPARSPPASGRSTGRSRCGCHWM